MTKMRISKGPALPIIAEKAMVMVKASLKAPVAVAPRVWMV